MQQKKTEQTVVHQELALDSYLSTLLNEIPDDSILDTVEQKIVVEKTALFKEQSTITVKPKQKKVKVARQINSESDADNVVNPLSVMPAWAQQEFQALFFKVDSLVLATPLTELLRTIMIEKAPTPLPGQPSWFMGLLDNHDLRIGVLDTRQLIFGKSRGQQRNVSKQPFKRILITHDGKWGLVCDEILSIGKLQPEKVRWRTMRQKRPWLIGTVIEELTAIVDVDQLVPHRKLGVLKNV